MITKKLAFPLVLLTVFFLYMTMRVSPKYSPFIAIPFLLLVMLFMFSPQIEWWYAKRNPPKVSPILVKYLKEHFKFFQELNGVDKDKFLERMTLFDMARVFIPQVGDKVPMPIKTMVCAEGVRLTFGLEDYLMLSHERIVIYPHPFPSPQHRGMHYSETYHKDGVLIFESSRLISNFTGSAIVFNNALYEWVSVFRYEHKNMLSPEFVETDWNIFAEKFNTPKQFVEASIGLTSVDIVSVAAVLYLTHKGIFQEYFPRQSDRFATIFKQ